MAIMAHNLTPSTGSHIAPMQEVNGRPGIVSELEKAVLSPDHHDRYDNEERSFWKRMASIKDAHAVIMQYDAKLTLSLRMGRNNMIESAVMLKEGDRADVWIAKKKRLHGTYRVIFGA